ncbi:hypothetical protein KUD11_05425 [Roseovarius sp. LXJ103]|uniref:hypothetical protein n=1 Tax=Roseovarius carneus TaxID=2853164 RepID=UPI000D61B28D|nr:hypothetical protein [Roseovarius carneus]MBZ8118082.1 hypothetical protein [Roseovarius carneus]PWE36177.1 hypothetical protein DD563_09545 [Pelagicola sp. LXJ1103]
MAHKDAPKKPAKTGETREDRLSAALKANLARRKAQARARGDGMDGAGQDGAGQNNAGQDNKG